jgi:hypothetical protein
MIFSLCLSGSPVHCSPLCPGRVYAASWSHLFFGSGYTWPMGAPARTEGREERLVRAFFLASSLRVLHQADASFYQRLSLLPGGSLHRTLPLCVWTVPFPHSSGLGWEGCPLVTSPMYSSLSFDFLRLPGLLSISSCDSKWCSGHTSCTNLQIFLVMILNLVLTRNPSKSTSMCQGVT